MPDITEPAVVNINTASAEELELLNGVGPETALAIIEFRETFGGFTSIYEIREVSGIGDSVFERIRDFITI
ncbi:MAG: ComEA family DNA-binding protein [Lachnospiraceae bacterium]|nr:ComEA family DNA-binding protein [Ruminococcus sp.]MCM1274834.1 ComEA family DNA-binding protein [Lachnospiraceae bacterium]